MNLESGSILPLCAPLVVSQRDALLAAKAVVVGGAAGRVEAHVALGVANLRSVRLKRLGSIINMSLYS